MTKKHSSDHNLGSTHTLGGGFIPEDARSHISHLSSKSRAPSLADLTGKPPGPYPGLGAGGLGFSRPGTFLLYSYILKDYITFPTKLVLTIV